MACCGATWACGGSTVAAGKGVGVLVLGATGGGVFAPCWAAGKSLRGGNGGGGTSTSPGGVGSAAPACGRAGGLGGGDSDGGGGGGKFGGTAS